MQEKKYTYIVEVIFEEVRIDQNAEPGQDRYLYLASEVFTFTDDNKSTAKQNAQRFFDKTVRHGLSRSAGSIIKSTVPAHSIKNIGIIDLNMYKEEQIAMQKQAEALAVAEEEGTLVSSQVETPAEPALVDANVAAN